MPENRIIDRTHNQPPTEFETTTTVIQDLFDEAKNWLDGDPLETPEQCDTLIKLVKDLRNAQRAADKARIVEVTPLNDAKTVIQEKYSHFIKKKTGLADMAIATANKVLAPYLAKLEAERLAKLEAARKQADELAAIAQKEMQASAGNLQERHYAEIAVEDAKHAASKAKKLDGQNITKGARTQWDVELVDSHLAFKTLWPVHLERFKILMTDIAKEQVKSGARSIKGFEITSRKII